MAYQKGYVLAVRQGNTTLKEENGKVAVPFGDDYSLRLKNKEGQDAVAFIYIDGRVVVKGGLVVGAHKTVDLERFVDGNLGEGSRFRFVPATDGRVADKGEPDNGLIEVKWHAVKPKVNYNPSFPRVEIHDHHHYPTYHYFGCGCHRCNPYQPNIVYCNSAGRGSSLGGGAVSSSGAGSLSSGATPTVFNTSVQAGALSARSAAFEPMFSDAGATVEGSRSFQGFESVDVDHLPEVAATLSLRLVGYARAVTDGVIAFCNNCGSKAGGRYCSSCGQKLI